MYLLGAARVYARFISRLGPFLAKPLDAEACRRLLEEKREKRGENFLLLLERSVYGYARSPYRPLLERAGIRWEDCARWVAEVGVEGCLERLRDAGVWVTIDAFKGKTGNAQAQDFENPWLVEDFAVMSGGTTGQRRRMSIDLDLLVVEAAAQRLFLEAHGLLGRPKALWRPAPPGSSGIKNVLRSAKLGAPAERWFNLSGDRREEWEWRMLLATAQRIGRRYGKAVPDLEPTPLGEPRAVVEWLHERRGILWTPATAAVAAARYASEQGIDIAGAVFWAGGEPITRAKREVIEAAGARVVNGWSLSEAGPIGIGCAHREHDDEIHVNDAKVALIRGEGDEMLLTSLLPEAPKLLLNVALGDTAVLTERRCGCKVEAAGFRRHAHTIRPSGKLTAGGMHFMNSDLLRLVEEVLPQRFGGVATDYQFAQEEGGVVLAVDPQVGAVDEEAVVAAVGEFFTQRSSGDAMMVAYWKAGNILKVCRRPPWVGPAGKRPAVAPMGSGDSSKGCSA